MLKITAKETLLPTIMLFFYYNKISFVYNSDGIFRVNPNYNLKKFKTVFGEHVKIKQTS